MVQIRPATPDDTQDIVTLLDALIAAGKRTIPGDEAYVRAHYTGGTRLVTHLALESDRVLGLQVLSRSDGASPYGTPEGWGAIGTHVHPEAGGRGIGRRLFVETLAAARAAGLTEIEAAIGLHNVEGQAYYEAMGFRTWRTTSERNCKRFDVTRATPLG
ncbi:L-amino acid N-acyltransferase YncA [Palleronia aestuarii]|uniref:L-amino acid N-acyltransferase YncA n=1 Tax=Palleronia aestuarii TaxID=568105 RepID=A0A2W7N7T9_9RHOB|nr:GNAT family N-acetyltransferase [Palleronia aestuarii]PZX16475.1 L-amino acid N-acyltransferase YncA [Palleronia aestuarii]